MSAGVSSLRRVWVAFGSAVLLAFVAIGCFLLFLQPDLDVQARNFNYIADWFPCALSIVLAVVPERFMRGGALVRVIIVLLGTGYSVVLWHRETLASRIVARDQNKTIQSVKEVQSDVAATKKEFEDNLTDLRSFINSGFGGLKPEPTEYATLQFSLYDPDLPGFPQLSESLRADSDDAFPIEFTFKNTSKKTTAEQVDVWLDLDTPCTFASPPESFQQLEPKATNTRHMLVPFLNYGAMESPIKMRVAVPSQYREFHFQFRYKCSNCGGDRPPQHLTVYVLPPYKTPSLPGKRNPIGN